MSKKEKKSKAHLDTHSEGDTGRKTLFGNEIDALLSAMERDTERGTLTLRNPLSGNERTLVGNYRELRETLEALAQTLSDLWEVSIDFSSEKVATIVAPQWELKLQTERLFRQEHSLPLDDDEEEYEEEEEL